MADTHRADHILLLEKSLSHQEYVLSHCQPAYLSHLNVTISYFRAQRDRILLGLTTVTIAVFTMQFCSGQSLALTPFPPTLSILMGPHCPC